MWYNNYRKCANLLFGTSKRTERTGEKTFRMTLHYRKEDETELLIKIISFGPLMKVVEPDSFAALIKERIERQFQVKIV